MKRRVADILVECLVENEITDCFSVVGGGAMHLNNAFVLREDIKKVYCHHEQACAMAAEGYAKAKGKMAAVCVTSGPGGLNALNGVEGAYVDNVPMIVISGHPRYETTVAATGLNLRYRGVQEFDIINAVKGMTKYAKLILNPYEVKREVYRAIEIAMSGRRGPVWLDIPLDIQSTLVEECELWEIEKIEAENTDDREQVVLAMEDIRKELSQGKRPCILTGSGIRVSGATGKFRRFATALQIPIVGGALQADIMPHDYPLYFGTSGNVGLRCSNLILQNADVILVIGNSLSFKQTGFKQEAFAKKARILMVDIEEDEAKKPGLHVDKCYPYDLKTFFDYLEDDITPITVDKEWIEYCQRVKSRFSRYEALEYVNREDAGVSSIEFWKELLEYAGENDIFALGNSSCIVPGLVFGVNGEKQRIIVNYNSGSMGDDLPEAVGIAVAMQHEVYCVTGDGSVMMNLQELQTIIHSNLPIKIIVFSNNGYGAIRRTCKNFFQGTYTGCDRDSGISFPDFEKVAKAFEMPYKHCAESTEIAVCIDWLKNQAGYCMLEVAQKEEDVMYPRLMSKLNEDGTFVDPELHDMYPFISEEELKEWMILV